MVESKFQVEMSEKATIETLSQYEPMSTTTFVPEPEKVEAFIAQMEAELSQDPTESSKKRSCFTPTFANARTFTWVMAVFASMGGLLFGLDQSLISGANLFMPADLGLTTVPVYVAESVPPTVRGNLVSLYQFNIALGEVFGYVVAAIFLTLPGNWRYMLGSSLVFSTIMFIGYTVKLFDRKHSLTSISLACCSCRNHRATCSTSRG